VILILNVHCCPEKQTRILHRDAQPICSDVKRSYAYY